MSETPGERADRECAEMTSDVFDAVSPSSLESFEGQEVFRYFVRKIKERFAKE